MIDNSLPTLRILIEQWLRETNLERKITKAKVLLEFAYPDAIVDIFLSNLDAQGRGKIKCSVEVVDHCAFIGTSQTTAESMETSLETMASQAGFPNDQQI